MTRSHKHNDPIRGVLDPEAVLPRHWGKAVQFPEPPKVDKKQGGGRANWGRMGDELFETLEYTHTKYHGRTNTNPSHIVLAPSKFEVNEEAPELPPALEDVTEEAHDEDAASQSSGSENKA